MLPVIGLGRGWAQSVDHAAVRKALRIKQFTAAAILQLRDKGKLGLDGDITKWFPDFDTRGARVPLLRLVDHTSEIRNLTTMLELAP